MKVIRTVLSSHMETVVLLSGFDVDIHINVKVDEELPGIEFLKSSII